MPYSIYEYAATAVCCIYVRDKSCTVRHRTSTLTSEFNALCFIHDSQEGWMLVAFTYYGCGRNGYISIIIAAVVAIICISVSIVDNVIMMIMVMVAITIDVTASAVDAIVVHWRRWHCRFHRDNIPIHFVVFILIWIIKFIGIQFRCRSNRIAIFIVAIAQNFLLHAVPVCVCVHSINELNGK